MSGRAILHEALSGSARHQGQTAGAASAPPLRSTRTERATVFGRGLGIASHLGGQK